MKTVISLFSTLTLLLLGCEGDDWRAITIQGKVINFGSEQPIAGAEVVLVDRLVNEAWFESSGDTDDRDHVFTDTEGNFKVSLKNKPLAYLNIQKERCSYENPYDMPMAFASGANEVIILKLKTEAPYRFNFISLSEPDEAHVLNVRICDEDGHTINSDKFTGVGPFFTEYIGTGDTYVTAQLHYYQNGQWIRKISDPHFLESYVTNTFTIRY